MRSFFKILLLCCAFASAAGAHAQGWKGIVPLHSTRADVERLLGPGGGDCKCWYDFEDDHVRLDYAKAPCEGYPSGWNVPADTVLTVTVYPERERQLSEFVLDQSKYDKDYEDTPVVHYSSREQGVQYSVIPQSPTGDLKNVISSIHYVPSSKDSRLRCPCFPPEDESIFKTQSYDQFSDLSYRDALPRLDNFAISLSESPEWKGYVIVYAGKQTSPATAKSYVQKFEKYLTVHRAVPAEKLSAMYGGYKDSLMVELYLFRRDMPPPRPRPTYEPCAVGGPNKRGRPRPRRDNSSRPKP
jgi:hypothetical protein